MTTLKATVWDRRYGPHPEFSQEAAERAMDRLIHAIQEKEKEMVRAKFMVQSITVSRHWDKEKGNLSTITLVPVGDSSEENKKFFAATPSGTIQLGTVNPEAAAQFNLGEEYYVDFRHAQSERESSI